MANNSQENNASQESLPLSQDTFAYLWDQLANLPPTAEDYADDPRYAVVNSGMEISQVNSYLAEISTASTAENGEQAAAVIPKIEEASPTKVPQVPSSLPASENWGGPFDFKFSFCPQEQNTKSVTWAYSKVKDKLYVGKDVPCPINFSADTPPLCKYMVRATALYGSPDHASEVVKRCVNHSHHEKTQEAEHLVRCECSMASYQVDAVTKRHSVVVPFEKPSAGQTYSTYIYKFACFGSCAGGPNRRPIMLVFTLEIDGAVVGRRKLDVKICACPGRDSKLEERQMKWQIPQIKTLPKKKKASQLGSDTLEFAKSLLLPPQKKAKFSHELNQYVIKTNDKKEYEFLLQMKKLHTLSTFMKNLHPDLKRDLSEHIRNYSTEGESTN